MSESRKTESTSAALSAMYQELILEHYRAPHGRGVLDAATSEGARKNPLCGDDVRIAIRIDGTRIMEAAFEGRGCSICTASASMLTDAVSGHTVSEARELIALVELVLHGESPPDPATIGDLIALAGVAAYPRRTGCAQLPWQALEQALDSFDQTVTSSNSSSIPPVMPPSTL